MVPGEYDLPLTENAYNVVTFTISGITTAVGYSANVDIRNGATADDDLVLALNSAGNGLVLTSNGTVLSCVMTITEAQMDSIEDALEEDQCYWSLKITNPSAITLQYLNGQIDLTQTPTE